MKCLFAENLNFEEWSIFIRSNLNSNIFQSPEMYQVYKKTKNHDPVFLAVTNDKHEVLGTLLAVIQKEHSGILGKFSARSIIIGGPLIKDNNVDVLSFILDEYEKEIRAKAIYTQIRNMFDQSWAKEAYEKHGFIYETHLDILIDLKQKVEVLWANLDSKARNKIRKAEKHKIEFQVLNPSEITNEISYCILKEVYARAKLPLAHKSLFENVYQLLGSNNMVKIFCAIKDRQIIGIRIGLIYKELLYDWYAGSLTEYYKYQPNDFLPWKVIEWGSLNGYETFDFGGAGKPNVPYGVRDHKLKFGGELVEYGRFELVHNKLLMNFGRIALKMYQWIK